MTRIQVSWLISLHMDSVIEIENQEHGEPWNKCDFLKCLRKKNVVGVVAEIEYKIVGFMLYELHQSMIRVLKFAVDSKVRRSGIGRQMIERMKDKLRQQRRTELEISIPELNLPAQLFFAACDFVCEESRNDEYVFRYWIRNAAMMKDKVI